MNKYKHLIFDISRKEIDMKYPWHIIKLNYVELKIQYHSVYFNLNHSKNSESWRVEGGMN